MDWKVLSLLMAVSSVGYSAIDVQPLLEVRLQNHLTSYASPIGSIVRCVVIRPLEMNGHVLIPKDSVVFGTVIKARRVGLGLIHEQAGLQLSFNQIEMPDGQRYPFQAKLASIDNAREHVTAKGAIQGVLAANNMGNLLNGFWFKPTSSLLYRTAMGLTGATNQVWAKYSMGPIGIGALFVVRCAILPFPEPEIRLPPGTDMKLRVSGRFPPLEEALSSPTPDASEAFSRWLTPKLDKISYHNGQVAPDLMNVAILGSPQAIDEAFTTSGWAKADPRSLRHSSRMYEAFSSREDYATAPVSRLYYRGREPDLIFEKSLDTITQRHHIRLWQAGTFEGHEVWLGAATHDTGIKFRMTAVAFTHVIDKDIDVEREKISTDLTFAGCADTRRSLDGVAVSGLYQSGRVSTDGRLTVLTAESCSLDGQDDPMPDLPGNKMSRLARRVILEARNYLWRDNTYYWAYKVIRTRSFAKSIAE